MKYANLKAFVDAHLLPDATSPRMQKISERYAKTAVSLVFGITPAALDRRMEKLKKRAESIRNGKRTEKPRKPAPHFRADLVKRQKKDRNV